MDLYEVNAQTMTKFKPKTYEQVRLENAADAWKVHKTIFVDPVTGEQQPGYQAWPEFRDEFLADWKSNRRLVTEKEADVIFDRIADESLTELENIPDVNALAEQVAQGEEEPTLADGTVVAEPAGEVLLVKDDPVAGGRTVVVPPAVEVRGRRGRPAGAKKASKPVKAKVTNSSKKKGPSTSERAESIIIRFVNKGWSRKEIIEKLVASIDGLGVAYASTLYQKFSK